MTRDVMIEAMKNGAIALGGTDATIIANKATVGLAYADAGFEGTDFSLASVTEVAATKDAALADVAEMLATQTLTTNIAQLATANDALTAFLVTADGDDDALTTATVASVNLGKTTALAALNALVDGVSVVYRAGTTAVRASLPAEE